MTITNINRSTLKVLDLGCGKKKRPGSIGVDFSDRHHADVIHDLNVFPYPFENDSIDKNIPMFIFKLINENKYISPFGGLLLIELHSPHRLDINDTYKEFEFYQDQQFEFVEFLPKNIKKDLTIRLHSAWQRMPWFEDKRWVDRFPKVYLEKGNSSIWALIKKNRLVVHLYDSTGILETLSLNIPTICFWHGGLTHLTPKAKPFYNLLRNVGILADSPKQAAKFIALHWDNIDGWWKSESVQIVRRIFCEQYARVEKKSLRDLKLALTSQVKN